MPSAELPDVTPGLKRPGRLEADPSGCSTEVALPPGDTWVPVRKAGHRLEQAPDSFRILDAKNRELARINTTAAQIWLLCDGDHELGELIQIMNAAHRVSPATVDHEIRQLLRALLVHGLMSIAGAGCGRNAAEIVNANEIRVTGLGRSGTHPIINWIGSNCRGERVLFINNVAPNQNPYASGSLERDDAIVFNGFRVNPALEKRGDFETKDCIIYSIESARVDWVMNPTFEAKREAWLGKSAKRFEVLVLRDAFNFFASRVRSFFQKDKLVGRPEEHVLPILKQRLPRWMDLWKNHAREFLGITHTLGDDTIGISYNAWCSNKSYRMDLAGKLGLETGDKGFDRVLNVGKGSSFDGLRYDGRASEMKTRERWKAVQGMDIYRGIFQDAEIVDLSHAIFGKLPGTDVLLP